VSDMVAARSGGSTGTGFASPAEIGDDAHGGPGRQPVRRPASLEAAVWASPVFVVGCPRSGTTLVQTMLDSHPRLSVLYEADLLVDIPLGLRSSLVNASEALTLAEVHPNSRTHGLDARTARTVCRELGITDAAGAMRVLAASQALAQGKRRWGNKTPKALLHLAELAIVYPDAQFIHVIRDGRDSASSQARVSKRSVVEGALLWRTGMRTGRRAGSRLGPDRYLEVRLEELLSSPEEQIRRMCAFLEEDFDQSLLHFHTGARERIPPSGLRIHPRLGEPPRPLPPSREGAATGLVQRAAAALIGAELVELGYVPAASSGRRRRIVYALVGYTCFLVSLRRSLRDLFRHFARSAGARRAARTVTRQSAGRQFQGGTLPRGIAMPATAEAWDEP
jgi:Sulfotransferase family